MGSGFSSCRNSHSAILNPAEYSSLSRVDRSHHHHDHHHHDHHHLNAKTSCATLRETEARRDRVSHNSASFPDDTASHDMVHNKKKHSSSFQRFYNPNERLDQEGQTLAGLPRSRTHLTIKNQQAYYDDHGDASTKHIYARRYLPSLHHQIEEDEEITKYNEHYNPNDFAQFYRRHYQTYLVDDFKVVSAKVPKGVGSLIYTSASLAASPISAVPSYNIHCISHEFSIYVADIGLTRAQCNYIIQTTESCAGIGSGYSSYTYAKQTMGCREHDELAMICEWPVQRAFHTIEQVSNHPFKLTLDEREPHVVKYDLSNKERQKLDVHTDKSEWTFLISLTTPNVDFQGGGTFFECINSVVHLQCGHVLIFPGKLRHAGRKILSGHRYLLVGFCVRGKSPQLRHSPTK